MSKQIEERVVSMQFDNSRFEKNVETSMSTLDKLKQKLNLSGASKGLESVQTAAGKVNMSGLASSVDTIQAKFSSLQVIGVTALANITNSAVNAGKRMVSSLLEPLTSGGYTRAMNLENARFQLKGLLKDEEKVAAVMQNVNDSVDGTAYSLDAAASVASQLAASGMEAGDSMFTSLRGVAGVAAMTNSSYEEIGRIFTQVAGQGRLMGDQLLQLSSRGMNAAATLAEYLGKTEEEVRDMVSAGEINFETFAAAMDDAFGEHAKEANNTLQGAFSNVKSALARIGAEFVSPLIKEKGPLVQFLNLIRERINDIKTNIVPIAEAVTTRINNFITSINNLLKKGSILGDGFSSLSKKLSSIMEPVNDTVNTVKEAVENVKDYAEVVNEIIRGDWGNGQSRWDKLTEAGYDWAHAQNLVNEKLGDSTRYTTDYEEAQEAATKSTSKATEVDADRIAELCKLSDAELEALGYTKDQIEAFRELAKAAEKVGLPISEFVDKIDEIDGKWLILESFANIGRSLAGVFKAMKTAWQEIFNPNNESMVQKIASKLFDLIAAFHKFTRSLLLTNPETGKLNANGEKLMRTFKGIFAIFDIVKTIVGGPLKLAFKILTKILGAFNLNILDVTAFIGDAIVKFRDWFKSVFDFNAVIDKLTPYLKKAAKAIKEWFAGMKDTKVVKTVSEYTRSAAKSVKEWFTAMKDNGVISTFVSYAKKAAAVMKEWFAALKETTLFKMLSTYLKSSADSIKEWFDGLKEADNIPKYIIQGLVNGLKSGIKMVASVIKELATTILDTIKGLLGIHSPSTELYDVGKNVILGLFNGIKDFVTMIYDIIMSIGGKVIEIVKNFDVGSVITAFVGSGLTIGFVKIANAFESLTKPLEGVGKILNNAANVVQSFSKVLGSVGQYVKAQALKTVAISIAILVGSVALLCLLPVGKVWASIGAIAALALILGGLTVAMGKFGPKEGVQFGKTASLLLSMAASILIIGIALKIIASLNADQYEQAIWGLAAIVVVMLVMMKSFSEMAKDNKSVIEAGNTMMKVAGAIAILAIVAKILGKMDIWQLIQGVAAVGVFTLIIWALMAIVKKYGSSAKQIGNVILTVAKAIAIMALVAILLGRMELWALVQGMVAVGVFTLIIWALMAIVKKYGSGAKVIGDVILKIVGAIAIMALVAMLLGKMNVWQLVQGVIAVAALSAIAVGLMYMVKKFGGKATTIAKTILAIAGAIAIMGVTAILLGMVSLPNLIKGLAAVTWLAAIAAALVVVTKKAGSGDCFKTLFALAISIGVMAAAVAVLSFINPGKLVLATACMSVLIGMMALLVASSGKANGSLGVIITLTVAMVAMGVLLVILATMPVEQTIGAAAALCLLLLTMTGVLYILAKMNNSVTDAVAGVIGLLLLCIPLVAVAAILCMMKDVNNALTNAQALSILMLAMSAVLGIVTICGTFASSAILGVAALLLLCVPLVAVAGILCMVDGLSNAMVNAMALALLISTLGDVCFKLALVGPLALIGVAAVTALTGLIIAVGVLAVAIGALMESCPALESFVDTGLAIMIKLAGGIGEMIGAFVSGVFTQIADSLPGIGLCLSQFMINATPFIVGAKLVDESVATGVGILVGAILALTVANFINGISELLPFVGSFADLGTQLSQFMTNATAFIIGAKMIDPESVEGVKTLVEAILLITAANLLESITSFLTGQSSMQAFGTQLVQLGDGLRGFIDALGPVSDEQVATAGRAAKIIKTLAEASAVIPNSGGLLADLVGDNDMGPWAAQLPIMAGGIANFTKTLTDASLTSESVTLADNAAKIVKTLAEAAAEIPNSGGLLADLVGDNDFSTWAKELPNVGKGIAGFTQKLRDAKINGDSVELAKKAASIVGVLAKASDEVPNSGGLLADLVGDNDFSTWAEGLSDVGKGVAGFAKELGTFKEDKLKTVNAGTNAVKVIAKMSEEYGSISDFGDFTNFGKGMVTLAEYIVDFCAELYDNVSLKTINNSVKKVNAVIELSKTVASTNVEKCETFGESLKTIAEDGITGFVEAFTDDDPKDKIKKAAGKLLTTFSDALKSSDNKEKLESAGTKAGKAASGGMDSKDVKEDAKEAGKNVVTGFANGIKNNKSLATSAGSALGKAALKAAKEALDENSPSKEMYKVGDYAGIGFVNALYDNVSQAYKAGTKVADSAKSGISRAVYRIADIVNSDIDAQPTIRPVLDLSDVRAGAGSINALFSGRTLAVDTSGVGVISASMNRRQNGGNSDVISAINGLKDAVKSSKGNTYNINGVTYDDGSNVSDAVGALIRAAKIERRV